MGRANLPSGTVTFLFTDVEGSTKLLHALGADAYGAALAEHRRVLRAAFAAHGGLEVDTQGDAFFVAFPTAPGALKAAAQARDALADGPIRVRIGIHTGTPLVTDEGYVGADVHRAARIAAAGHGGQILVSSATAALVGKEDLRDLGEHRLKDLTAPERIYQVGPEDHPPLKTLHQTNLPIPATPFLGREAEVAEVNELLTREGARLVTITGPGGMGKTRLALQASASAAESFPDGVWWVPLAPLRDPRLVLETAAKALGASGELAEHIGERRMLLLFDNFEHLVEAARDVGALLGRCPNLSLLVTSREPLRLDGEWEYALDPMRDPEAVELFLTRAKAARRDFHANGEVAAICARLDNLPLAIELAAARVKMLSPAALLERLEQRLPLLAGGARDLPERQRTLRATIEWSHELLTPDEQRLFARLAVFRGGCTLGAAEAVADAAFDTLQSLVDKSLVRVREDRFWMLETIREYALESLEASGETDQTRSRHASHFLGLAEEAEEHLGGDPTVGLRRLDPEQDNLRAALDRLYAAGEIERFVRLVSALSEYWSLRGQLVERRDRFSVALASYTEPTAVRAKALVAAARHDEPRPEQDRGWAEEALSIYHALGDVTGAARARYALANSLAGEGRWAEARDLMEESVAAFEQLGDHFRTVAARRGLAWMHEELGDEDRFRELTEQNLVQAREHGIRRIEARALGALAMRAIADARLTEARAMLAESYRIDSDLGNVIFISVDLVRYAALCAAEGRPEPAARLLATSQVLCDETGWTRESWAADEFESVVADVRRRLDAHAFEAAWNAGLELSPGDAVALALAEAER